MSRAELSRILRAASKIAGDEDVVVVGSQSILGTHDEDDLPAAAVASVEVDVTFWDDPGNAKSDAVDGAIGEDSAFHRQFGIYAQGVDLTTATLPAGWRRRVVLWSSRSSEPGRAHCLDAHDLALSKLVAQRQKDYVFVGALLDAGLLDPAVLLARALDLPTGVGVQRRVIGWVTSYINRRAEA